MKTQMNFQEVLETTSQHAQDKQDFLVDTRRLGLNSTSLSYQSETGMNSNFVLSANDLNEGEWGVTDYTHGQIAARNDVPKKHYDRLKTDYPELLENEINTFFEKEPDKRMIRTLHGKARAYLSDQYRRIDNFDIVSAILPLLTKKDLEVVSCNVSMKYLHIKAVMNNMVDEVEVGDTVKAGFVIKNSEIGASSACFQPMLFRLACSNGLVQEQRGYKQRHLGQKLGGGGGSIELSDETKRKEDEVVISKMKDITRSLTDGDLFENIVQEAKAAVGREVEQDLSDFTEELGDRFGFTEDQIEKVKMEMASNEHDLTQWGTANAISRVSQDFEDYNRATQFEYASGEVLSFSESQWNRFSQN